MRNFLGSQDWQELCNNAFKIFEKSPLNIENYRYQTMDGAANMSGRNKGCSTLLQEKTSQAVYKVPDIYLILDSFKQLNIFQIFTKAISPF